MWWVSQTKSTFQDLGVSLGAVLGGEELLWVGFVWLIGGFCQSIDIFDGDTLIKENKYNFLITVAVGFN